MPASEIFHTVGRRLTNQILNGSASIPASWYLLLRTLNGSGSNPTDANVADTLSSNLAEASGAGYARISVKNTSTNVAESASSSNSILSMTAQTFSFSLTAGSPLTGCTHVAWATSVDNSGVLFCSMPLGTTRNFIGAPSGGDTSTVTCTFTMSG